jgi:hypothetical protein
MLKKIRLLLLLTLALLLARPALAWDALGHKVISLIAWEHMRPETRAKAVALLKAAPPDADLASLLPNDGRPLAERERELFLRASTWPDIVRDEAFAERKKKYHHSDWHYVNHYWELDEKGQPRATGRPPEEVNIVERLHFLERSVVDPSREASLRAIDLAWLLHLEGDLHQPLHASSRVSLEEPKGDRGGGAFKLDEREDLHWYWDQLLSKVFRKRKSESDTERVERVARVLQEHHPRSSFTDLQAGQYEAWARKGFETSKSFVYQGVERGRVPGRGYRKAAFELVEPEVALAGYRLAEMLDRVLGGPTS